MPAPLEKTRTPGIFKRGSRYVFSYRIDGKQRWESCRTLDEARRAKAARATDIERGEFEQHSRITLHEYAREWIERYQGTGRRGFREETRTEYRALLDRFALSYFSERTRLTDITPRHVAGFIAWLCKRTKRAPTGTDKERRVLLSDNTVRTALSPLKACLSTARREGLIRHNPATDATLPHRATVDADEDRPRPFPRVEDDEQGELIETMELVVQLVPSPHRLMFELLAATGVRRSELLAFEGRHLVLDEARPYVKVRQRVRRRRGEGLVIGSLKSRYSRRDLPTRGRWLKVSLRSVPPNASWCSALRLAKCSIPTISPRESSRPRARLLVSHGLASILSGTRSHRGCSQKVAMWCRYSAGSATIRPVSRLIRTSTYSTTISASR